ncbi:MAG: Unknown protein [uncultured Aureispira sp.]|uniref:Uncharacterized protein n=1 Tax=uncultured Aureispira sp. TaxID=1331704 RepID=A0A6S6T7K5_9BACT|nr:MAG: Unknown protein [uncultured Aureispira sp.]
MEKQNLTLLLTTIHCVKSTTETTCDDIYFEIYATSNGVEKYLGSAFKGNPIQMEGGKKVNDAYLDISFDCSYMDECRILILENDNNGHDTIGNAIIKRDDPLEGTITVNQTTGKAKAVYELSYRVISKPIQTLRVMGVYCEEDSKGCNVDLVEDVLLLAEKAAEEASDVIKKSPRPRAKAVSKAFDVAANVLANIGDLVVWIANAAEGADEVYMQHVDKDGHDIEGGGFWPEDGIQQMEKGDQFEFTGDEGDAAYSHYYRVPLDRGPVTLQLRERDPHKADVSIGSFTFDEAYYNKYEDEGRVVIADEYFRDQQGGQGAIYGICVSVGIEDWAKPAIVEEQEG